MELNTFETSRKRSCNCFFRSFFVSSVFHRIVILIFFHQNWNENRRELIYESLRIFTFFSFAWLQCWFKKKLMVRWAQMLIDKLFFIENFVLFQRPMERKEGSETYPNKHNSILLPSRFLVFTAVELNMGNEMNYNFRRISDAYEESSPSSISRILSHSWEEGITWKCSNANEMF